MQQVLNISQAASLALHTMGRLAAADSGPITTKNLAHDLGVSEAHLAKIMARLGKAGLVSARRGPQGGFVLAVDPDRVNLLQVYEAAEGPLPTGGCLLDRPVCDGNCLLGDLLQRLGREVRQYLERTYLSDVTQCKPSEVNHESVA